MSEMIYITEPANVVVVDNFIKKTRLEQGCLAPDKALAVLSKTNHFFSIKSVVKEINKLEVEDRKAYKDFVLGAVNGRETTAEVLESLRELAIEGGYEQEFDEVNSEHKYFAPTDWNVFIAKSKDDFAKDLSGYSSVFCDFVDDCGFVNLCECDLRGVQNLKFREGTKVLLYGAKNLPSDLDVSMCKDVDLRYCDLSGVEKIKFNEVMTVDLCEAHNLPGDFDVSMCDKVSLNYCDFSGVKNLKFKEGATVYLSYAKNLPKDLDVSQCDVVWLYECDLSGVESVKFKDNAQKENFMRDSANFSGKVVYTDIKAPFTNGGMEI